MQEIKHELIQNGLMLVEIEIAAVPYRFVLDETDYETLFDRGPWYLKKQSKSKNGMPYLINRKSEGFLRLILNANENQRVFNVSRNPFDLRKCNYILVENGKHRSVDFQKMVQQRLEENNESNAIVVEILGATNLTAAGDEIQPKSSPEQKQQDQVGRLDPAGTTRIWQEYASNNIKLEFEGGSVQEISLNEAKWLEQALKTFINRAVG